MKILFAVFFTLILSACAMQPTLQTPTTLYQTHGYVIADIPYVAESDKVRLTLRSLVTGEEFIMVPTQVNNRVHALWVPAGKYEITEMVGKNKGGYTPIEVSAGKVADLGGITWVDVGDQKRVLIPIRHPDLAIELTAATDAVKAFVPAGRTMWQPVAPPPAQNAESTATNLGLIADLIKVYSEEVNKTQIRVRLRETGNIELFTKLFMPAAPGILGDPAYDQDGALYCQASTVCKFTRWRAPVPPHRYSITRWTFLRKPPILYFPECAARLSESIIW